MENKNIFEYMLIGFTKNYAKFDGRARSKEYWSIILFFILTLFLPPSYLNSWIKKLVHLPLWEYSSFSLYP